MAIATPPGEGGVAIVRLSGSDAPRILGRLCERSQWESHRLYLSRLRQEDGSTLDQGMAVWMKAPRSYTGEEVVELHLHGGHALAQLAVQTCLRLGARLARPGEFTLRAFLHGKLDLAQAEAVQQLIQSRSLQAAQLASRNLLGVFSQQVESLRSSLLEWLALLEAEIDFGDEVSGLGPDECQRRWQTACLQVEHWLQQGSQGKLLSDGLRLVLLGAPNAGKSTLLNLLLGRQRALVTPLAGTTRDTLEEGLVLGGVPVVLVDTAGVREAAGDLVEELGIARSREEAQQADLLVWVVDGSLPEPPEVALAALLEDRPHLTLLTKRDLGLANWTEGWNALAVSLLDGRDEPRILQALTERVRALAGDQSELFRLTPRQWESLLAAQESLLRLGPTLERGLSAEFLALDLRAAVSALGQIQGIDVSEEVLDRIFSTFCLGK